MEKIRMQTAIVTPAGWRAIKPSVRFASFFTAFLLFFAAPAAVFAPPAAPVRKRGDLPTFHADAQSRLKDYLQSSVEIKRSQRGKGSLTILFNSDSDFQRIVALLDKDSK